MPNKIILDTETISLQKPFVYDIGFIIVDENFKTLESRHFVIQQVYDNKELFATAYYSVKKPRYIKLLRLKRAEKIHYGKALQKIKHLMKKYEVNEIYAYNSPFDKRALEFTTNFYKVQNVFENKEFIDIKKLAKDLHNQIDYLLFTETHNKRTPTGRPSKTAETTYQFIINDPNFVEDHMGLQDCEIELEILRKVA